MAREVWDRLLAEAKAMHEADEALTEFCPFPDDVTPQEVSYFHIPPHDLLIEETGFLDPETPIRRAFIDAGALAKWRETYKGTDIGDDFMNRFGCYCLIGEGGAFHSDQMAAWVVYMPPHLHYPWHHHPGEEMYRVIGGEGRFMRKGMPDEWLKTGDACEHASNQPHALDTEDSPIMAYVVWRNGFETPPVLTR